MPSLGEPYLSGPTINETEPSVRFCWGFGGVAGAIVGGACEYVFAMPQRTYSHLALQLKVLLRSGLASSRNFLSSLLIHICCHVWLLHRSRSQVCPCF